MLYDAWKQIARTHRHELALADLGSNERWTFAELEARAEELPSSPPVVFPEGLSSRFIFQVLRGWRGGGVVCPLDNDQPAPTTLRLPEGFPHVKITSGSSGAPRMIAFTAAQLQADAANIVATMGLRPDWPNLAAISIAHSYGFSNLVLPLLLHGIPLILLPSRLPEALREALLKFDAVTLPAVPALWRVWHEAGVLTPAIKLAISAGAPLPSNLETDVFNRCGLKLHNFYGASECGGICYDATETPRASSEDVGTPMQNIKVETDEAARLVVFSKAVGETYWPIADATLGGGRFQTNDSAHIHGGRVFLRGRQSDLINLAGQKVAPETIERALLQHPRVRDCVVFGITVDSAIKSEAIVACVSADQIVEAETLKQFLLQTIPSWQVPRHWWFVPVAASGRGKISRAQWRERYLANQPRPA